MITMRTFMVPLALALALGGCGIVGGDDDDSGGSAPDLTSTSWFGPLDQFGDDAGTMYRLGIEFDDDGNVSDITIDEVSQGTTGEVNHEKGDIFGFQLDDGTTGGFLVSGDHMAFITEDQDIGVLQKGAQALADEYTVEELEGSWAGYSVSLDADFNLLAVIDSEVTVQADGSFEGSSDDGSTFESTDANPLEVTEALYGRFYAQSIEPSDPDFYSNINLYVTPDKQFAGSSAQFGSYPDEVTFNSWEKQ